jgi:hypothetical protein
MRIVNEGWIDKVGGFIWKPKLRSVLTLNLKSIDSLKLCLKYFGVSPQSFILDSHSILIIVILYD